MDNQQEVSFAEKHPRINMALGIIFITAFGVIGLLVLKFVFMFLKDLCISFSDFLGNFVKTTDKVIVVAMITGSVSIIGVVISSIIAKVVEYRFNVKNYYMINVRSLTNSL